MANLIYLVEITAYDPSISGTRVLRYCSGIGYVTQPTETPANTYYEPRIVQPCNFTRTAFSDSRIMGGTADGYGEIILNNADQALCPMMNYGMDGRQCLVLVGQQTAGYPSGFSQFINGTIEQCEVGSTKVTLRLRDNLMLLSIPVQQTLYLGNNVPPNGAEGVDDIMGQPKPLTYGHVYHVLPVLVNTFLLIYQVHDGVVAGIDSVMDGGSPLTFAVNYPDLATLSTTLNQPAAGHYSTCLALGLFRLGALATKVTAHVRGDANVAAGGYVNKVAGIVKRILTQRGGIAAAACDASFAAMDVSFPAEIGIFIGQSSSGSTAAPPSTVLRPIIASAVGVPNTVQSACEAVLLTAGAWLAPSRIGTWTIGQLLAPGGSPVANFTDVDLISIDSEATSDPTAGVPVFTVNLRYKNYPGVLAVGDPVGTLSAAQVADVTMGWRSVSQKDATVQTVHLLAAQLYRDTCFATSVDATNEAIRVLNLHKVRRDFVKATLYMDETKAVIDLGSVIQLTTPRLGYSAGKLFVVVGISSDGRKNELTLDLWG